MQIISCVKCKRVVLFSLMADAESPRTLFDLVLTRFEKLAASYDNGCNFLHFFLNREPEIHESVDVYIDVMHHRGHVKCLPTYRTGARSPCAVLLTHGLYAS